MKKSLLNPFGFGVMNTPINSSILGAMYLKFNSTAAAFSYLMFILLYSPCISVIVVIIRTIGFKWAVFSVLWTSSLAYILAVACYQLLTANNWLVIASLASTFIAVFIGITYLFKMAIYKIEEQVTLKLIPTKVTS